MQKDEIIRKLKERGCRITRQRLLLLDITLENECSSCKEILYRASKIDAGIGMATVYRMVNILEEIGAISRKGLYKIDYSKEEEKEEMCVVTLEDSTTYHLSAKNWNQIVQAGLDACGYLKGSRVASVTVRT